jgi:hypothetical protein
MAVIHGDAGLGKRFSVEAAQLPSVPLVWVSYPSRPTRLIPPLAHRSARCSSGRYENEVEACRALIKRARLV